MSYGPNGYSNSTDSKPLNFENSLWRMWTKTCCLKGDIEVPTDIEWKILEKAWYQGKAPNDSVKELKHYRNAEAIPE